MDKIFKIGAALCAIFTAIFLTPILVFWDFFNDPTLGTGRTIALQVGALVVIVIVVLVLARRDVI